MQRPEGIKKTDVFILRNNPETGEPVDINRLLPKLGEIGYRGVVVDPAPPKPLELLDYDPEIDGILGINNFEDIAGFVEAQGLQKGTATKLYGRFAEISFVRATNNKLWEVSTDLRVQRKELNDLHSQIIDDINRAESDRPYDEERAARNVSTITGLQEEWFKDAERIAGQLNFRIRKPFRLNGYLSKMPLDQRANYVDTLLNGLVNPAEMGKPFVYINGWEDVLEPVTGVPDQTNPYANTWIDRDEAYKLLKAGEVFDPGTEHQKIHQLAIAYFNKAIANQKSNTA